MFGKLKASLGIGAAKVDTVLHNMSLSQGETLEGTVHIQVTTFFKANHMKS